MWGRGRQGEVKKQKFKKTGGEGREGRGKEEREGKGGRGYELRPPPFWIPRSASVPYHALVVV